MCLDFLLWLFSIWQVEYYGTPVSLKSIAQISTPDASSLLVQPYDKSRYHPVIIFLKTMNNVSFVFSALKRSQANAFAPVL